MSRKRPEIHFTTHSCLEGRGADAAEALVQRCRNHEDPYLKNDRRYRDAYVRQCCWGARRRKLDERDSFTTAISQVTCRSCLDVHVPAQLDEWRTGKGYGGASVCRFDSPADAAWIVWRRCCRTRGAAPGEAIAVEVAQREGRELASAVSTMIVEPVDCKFEILRALRFDRVFEAIGTHEQLTEALREGIDHLTMAGDLLAEVERLVGLASTALRTVDVASVAEVATVLHELDRLGDARQRARHERDETLRIESWARYDAEHAGAT